jgi:hypothetical protein
MRKRLFVAVVAIALTASGALAGDLVTPTLQIGTSHGATCRLQNLTQAPLLGQEVQLWSTVENAVLADTGVVTVPAGVFISAGFAGISDVVYCRFIKASKSKTRCSLSLTGVYGDGTEATVIPAN